MDLTNKPDFFRKYKIQPEAHVPLDKKRFLKASIRCVVNQFVGILFGIVLHHLSKGSSLIKLRDTTSFPRLIFDLLGVINFYEIGFYYSHRMLHHRWFYKHVHKIHHEWTAPVSTMTFYCHWLGKNLGSEMRKTLHVCSIF
jgi:fatty acid hydroxylase domain-containing protein 2